MAVSFSHSISFLLLPLLLSLAINHPASADRNLIDSICQKTQNPNLCQEVFKGSADADGATLAQTAVKLALDNAESTSKLINSLLKSATNPRQKDEYQTCLEVYDDAADNLNQCNTLLASKQFEDANVKASAALTDADTCVDEAEDVPPNDPQKPLHPPMALNTPHRRRRSLHHLRQRHRCHRLPSPILEPQQ